MLIRVLMGGACQPEVLELPDEALKQIARSELSDLVGVQGRPVLIGTVRWHQAMPQFHIGHLALVEKIEGRCESAGQLAVLGNAYRGVGIPHCIHQAEREVERLLEEMPISEERK